VGLRVGLDSVEREESPAATVNRPLAVQPVTIATGLFRGESTILRDWRCECDCFDNHIIIKGRLYY
jgi:hypothetical protein